MAHTSHNLVRLSEGAYKVLSGATHTALKSQTQKSRRIL